MTMSRTARIYTTGNSQIVILPAECRFEGNEIFVHRDPATGDVILSRKPHSWDGLLELQGLADVPDDFMRPTDRRERPHDRDPFEGWTE
ncbi:AbrB/MazE/SpoVT family DNA-binding domain-containing protein [Rhodopseudomonas palustris]|uniref:antitoxin n=1 Tax=Rhodopseudomonas palustris TaxID=1076 RepID=UPI0020CDD7E3|nr:AbrB/MazE/SpoVT family DNA-binding domain-containing protein [Rhodopseudomonas palustris]MCP9626229.1 AbrB/MazE/SpoVT family DNA-binding domain-containing protein [Rhodopseudomonas palustris]